MTKSDNRSLCGKKVCGPGALSSVNNDVGQARLQLWRASSTRQHVCYPKAQDFKEVEEVMALKMCAKITNTLSTSQPLRLPDLSARERPRSGPSSHEKSDFGLKR